ncbi:MAG TPA: GSCFA domain-containing protein [Bacteroidales bacterium]|nr:GSCFA domain-containing protein [Bacteroidales bacterium]
MDLRTAIQLPPSLSKITHTTPVMFMGSCFANEIGYRLSAGKLSVMTNPHGTLFNPFSVAKALERFADSYLYTEKDIYLHQNRYLSLDHHTAYSSYERDVLIERLNETGKAASEFIRKSSFLFVTFGTSYIFTLNESGDIVANCHKLPSGLFSRRMTSHAEMAERWKLTLDRLAEVNPGLKVWFTVSPVRHLNEGPHANQLSKAHLLLAVEELLKHPLSCGYFPAYEIFMDDLRDYRYYGSDMVHPSETAIDYTWEKFASVFIESPTLRLWSEASKITRAVAHRQTGEKPENLAFAAAMLEKIEELRKKAPFINFSTESSYFNSLA